MIVVTLTSWTKRIDNVRPVVEIIMKNTIVPDRVYLNLSKTEFQGVKLPKDLVDYFNSDNRLIINWVSGPNTKSMKKVFPILKYLQDDDIIIDADDDILFPRTLIESRLEDFKKNGSNYSISSNPHTSVGFNGKMKVVSAMSLFQKKMLKHWERFVSKDILETNNDDRTYLHLLWLNGYLNRPCTRWTVQQLLKEYDMKPGFTLSATSKNFRSGRVYDIIAQKSFYQPICMNIEKSFGLWR